MERSKWIERKFSPIGDNGLFPGILERVEGTPARLYYKLKQVLSKDQRLEPGTPWSIKKEIGHLTDLEPLWLERVQELINNTPLLTAADMSNQKTNDTPHDEKGFEELMENFFQARQKLVSMLKSADSNDLLKKSIHPRLQMPVRMIDLAFLVAEHDDHHLAQITRLVENDKGWMDQNLL